MLIRGNVVAAVSAVVLCCGLATGMAMADTGQASGVAARGADPAAGMSQPQLAAWLVSDAGLPNFDIRFGADGEPSVAARESLVKAVAAREADGKRAQQVARLRSRVADVTIREDAAFGTPRHVGSWSQMLTGDHAGMDARAIVREFIVDNALVFEVGGADVDAARVTRDYHTDHNGVRHLTLQQVVDGVDLFDAGIKANVSREGRLINISSTMLPAPAGGFNIKQGGMTDVEAIRAGAKAVGVIVTEDPTRLEVQPGNGGRAVWRNSADFRTDQPILSQRVLFPVTRDDVRAAWWVVIPTRGTGHTYEMVIDAADGTVLQRANELCSEVGEGTFRVYTGRSPTPGVALGTNSGFKYPFDSRDLVTVTPSSVGAWSPFGWFDTNGVAGAENTDTRGNNVDAHLDRNADNAADLPRPSGGASLVFDLVQNNGADPLTWGEAAVVQGFYYTNLYHDRLYALGFNEVAGNFQVNNYGRGGAQNDPVQLDVQDGSGTNNANFGTPVDGSSGRCQMYRFTGPTPDRDSAMDMDVMFHEFSHGLSNRLTGGPANSSALNAVQSGGMGEGWGDFVGMSLAIALGEDPNATFNTGSYVTDNYYRGIRRYPYTTDMAKNPLTWDAYGTSGTSATGVTRSTEVHNTGEIWAVALTDVRAALFKRSGFAANQIMLQLVVDGMKLQPALPSFLDARDAILAADLANNGGVNQYSIWRAFAKRGLGLSAATASSAATSVTLAFDFPALAENGDAGELTTTAQVVSGSGALTQITGAITSGNVDLYRIGVCDVANFSATTVGGASFDTQLFLFNSAGVAVTFNDDASATAQSRITGQFLTGNGDYFLAVCGADRDPVSAGGDIFTDTPTTTERQPTGPGASGALAGWTGADSSGGGAYTIVLTGACAATVGDVAQQPKALMAHGAPVPHVLTYGSSTITRFLVYVSGGTLPTSTGVTVSVNASSIGLGTLTLLDAGGAGDTAAGDKIYSAQATAGVLGTGNYLLPYHVQDAQGRVVDDTLLLTVVDYPGACCTGAGACSAQTIQACSAAGGVYKGIGLPCEVLPCRTSAEIEPNGTIATATNARPHFTAYTGNKYQIGFSGDITADQDFDYVAVGAMQVGDIITASQSGAPSGRGTNVDTLVRLYRNGSTSNQVSDDDSGPGFDALIWRFSVATADSYFVRAYHANATNNGTYQVGVMLENTGAAPTTGGSFTAEAEPNNSAATANNAINSWRPVQYLASTSGTITSGDTDVLAYTFQAGDLVSANVVGLGTLDARLALLDSTAAPLAAEDGTSVGPTNGQDSPIFGYVIPATGTYYLSVTAAAGTGNYYAVVYLSSGTSPLPCAADFNGSGGLSVQDIFDFLAAWFAGTPGADFNGAGGITVQDIFDFLAAWFAGC